MFFIHARDLLFYYLSTLNIEILRCITIFMSLMYSTMVLLWHTTGFASINCTKLYYTYYNSPFLGPSILPLTWTTCDHSWHDAPNKDTWTKCIHWELNQRSYKQTPIGQLQLSVTSLLARIAGVDKLFFFFAGHTEYWNFCRLYKFKNFLRDNKNIYISTFLLSKYFQNSLERNPQTPIIYSI